MLDYEIDFAMLGNAVGKNEYEEIRPHHLDNPNYHIREDQYKNISGNAQINSKSWASYNKK